MTNWLESLLDLIFPPHCEVCRNNCRAALCPDCRQQIKFLKPHLGLYAAAEYDGVLKTALHRLKFQKVKRLAGPLGLILAQYLGGLADFKQTPADLIVPVPLHPRRQRLRGYNQSLLLAQVIGQQLGLPVQENLARIKDTRPQFDLPRTDRFKNIAGAFQVKEPETISGRRLILLDDIYTTGATVAECVKALRPAAPRGIVVVTLARATGSEHAAMIAENG